MPLPIEPDLSRPFDVVIVGAGLAGSSLALGLARRGLRVALLDHARFPHEKLCGEFLSPEAWIVFERLGLSEAVTRLGYHPIHRIRLSTPWGRILEAKFTDPDGLPGIGLSRSALDALLVQHARDAGTEVIEGARVGPPIVQEGRVAGVKVRHLTREEFEVRATVTIAADGRYSGLVQRTGTTRPRGWLRPRLFGMKRHLITTDPDAEPAGTVGLHLFPGGYGGTCRIEAPLINLCALLPESALHRHRGNLDRLAGEQFGHNPLLSHLWRTSHPAGGWKTVSGVRVQAAVPTLPGIFYVGDAQGTIDPLGGQGMTMALLGVEVLLPFLTQALVEGGASTSLQRAYVTAWHRRFDHRIRLCQAFHHLLLRPQLIDLASTFPSVSSRLLVGCFHRTRDPGAS
jgi:2-polyprenyl-6-methoxyphenol hydroxylase-like FAD-dependent oxidoreductase